MPITTRDAPSGTVPGTRNIASLVGGCVIAIGCFVLFLLVAAELTPLTWPVIAIGAGCALGVGIWIRVADL